MLIKVNVWEKTPHNGTQLIKYELTEDDIENLVYHKIVEDYGLRNAASYDVDIDSVTI